LEIVEILGRGRARGDVNDAAPFRNRGDICRQARQANAHGRDGAIANQDDKTSRIRHETVARPCVRRRQVATNALGVWTGGDPQRASGAAQCWRDRARDASRRLGRYSISDGQRENRTEEETETWLMAYG